MDKQGADLVARLWSSQVTVNWFQLQQAQVVSLPVNHQSLCERAKLYEPGQCYVQYVSSLPTGPDASSEPKAG